MRKRQENNQNGNKRFGTMKYGRHEIIPLTSQPAKPQKRKKEKKKDIEKQTNKQEQQQQQRKGGLLGKYSCKAYHRIPRTERLHETQLALSFALTVLHMLVFTSAL